MKNSRRTTNRNRRKVTYLDEQKLDNPGSKLEIPGKYNQLPGRKSKLKNIFGVTAFQKVLKPPEKSRSPSKGSKISHNRKKLSGRKNSKFGDQDPAKADCLELSYNNLTSLQGLEIFKSLRSLSLIKNKISSITEFKRLPNRQFLKHLNVAYNPFTINPNYRIQLINMFPNLTKLDGMTITEDTRRCNDTIYRQFAKKVLPFMLNFEIENTLLEILRKKIILKNELKSRYGYNYDFETGENDCGVSVLAVKVAFDQIHWDGVDETGSRFGVKRPRIGSIDEVFRRVVNLKLFVCRFFELKRFDFFNYDGKTEYMNSLYGGMIDLVDDYTAEFRRFTFFGSDGLRKVYNQIFKLLMLIYTREGDSTLKKYLMEALRQLNDDEIAQIVQKCGLGDLRIWSIEDLRKGMETNGELSLAILTHIFYKLYPSSPIMDQNYKIKEELIEDQKTVRKEMSQHSNNIFNRNRVHDPFKRSFKDYDLETDLKIMTENKIKQLADNLVKTLKNDIFGENEDDSRIRDTAKIHFPIFAFNCSYLKYFVNIFMMKISEFLDLFDEVKDALNKTSIDQAVHSRLLTKMAKVDLKLEKKIKKKMMSREEISPGSKSRLNGSQASRSRRKGRKNSQKSSSGKNSKTGRSRGGKRGSRAGRQPSVGSRGSQAKNWARNNNPSKRKSSASSMKPIKEIDQFDVIQSSNRHKTEGSLIIPAKGRKKVNIFSGVIETTTAQNSSPSGLYMARNDTKTRLKSSITTTHLNQSRGEKTSRMGSGRQKPASILKKSSSFISQNIYSERERKISKFCTFLEGWIHHPIHYELPELARGHLRASFQIFKLIRLKAKWKKQREGRLVRDVFCGIKGYTYRHFQGLAPSERPPPEIKIKRLYYDPKHFKHLSRWKEEQREGKFDHETGVVLPDYTVERPEIDISKINKMRRMKLLSQSFLALLSHSAKKKWLVAKFFRKMHMNYKADMREILINRLRLNRLSIKELAEIRKKQYKEHFQNLVTGRGVRLYDQTHKNGRGREDLYVYAMQRTPVLEIDSKEDDRRRKRRKGSKYRDKVGKRKGGKQDRRYLKALGVVEGFYEDERKKKEKLRRKDKPIFNDEYDVRLMWRERRQEYPDYHSKIRCEACKLFSLDKQS